MILLYKPTVQGPIERLDTDDPESVRRAMGYLAGTAGGGYFQMLVRDAECAGCREPILRGDVARSKPMSWGARTFLFICRCCSVAELLPLHDALYGDRS